METETRLDPGQPTPFRHRRHFPVRFPAQSGVRPRKPSSFTPPRGTTGFPRFPGTATGRNPNESPPAVRELHSPESGLPATPPAPRRATPYRGSTSPSLSGAGLSDERGVSGRCALLQRIPISPFCSCMHQKSRQKFITETRRHGGEFRASDMPRLRTRKRRQKTQDQRDESHHSPSGSASC